MLGPIEMPCSKAEAAELGEDAVGPLQGGAEEGALGGDVGG